MPVTQRLEVCLGRERFFAGKANVILFDDYQGPESRDGLRATQQDLLFESFNIDLDVVDVLQGEVVQSENGNFLHFTRHVTMCSAKHGDDALLITQGAVEVRRVGQIDIPLESRVEMRIKSKNPIEIFAQEPRIFPHPASHIDRRTGFLDKGLGNFESQLAVVRR